MKTCQAPSESTLQIIAAFLEDPTGMPLVDEVILEDHAQDRVYEGRCEVEGVLRAFFSTGFLDVEIEAHSHTADAISAVIAFEFRGRQNGPFLGIPATGREVILPMMIDLQISNGRVHRLNLYYDASRLLRQMGLAL